MDTIKSVSILKETRDDDRRVIMLPDEIRQFVDQSFQVYVEHDAGIGLGISDDAYKEAGAEIVSREDAWRCSPYVLKYRFPSEAEYPFFQPDMHLCCWLYASENQPLVRKLCEMNITAYAYEFFKSADGLFPLMASDSEISGHLAVIYGAHRLLSTAGGSGILLCHVPYARRAKVIVIGHGNSGGAAARTAAALGANVVVLGSNPVTLRKFQASVPTNVTCYVNTPEILEREIPDADLVIGAILISTFDTQTMIGRDLVRQMKPRSVIVDITCGYGKGYLPTAHSHTRDIFDIYQEENVWHIKNDLMPYDVPVTSTQAGSRNLAPYLVNLGNAIFSRNVVDPVSDAAKVTENGRVVHPEIIKDFQLMKKLEKEDVYQ